MSRLDLKDVTLVSMTSLGLDDTINCMKICCEEIDFGEIKIISHVKPDNLPLNFNFSFIKKINSLDEYSYNMIYKLDKFINTKFALIIQSDGYIINPKSWRSEFLDYDYIGAPFVLPKDDFSYRDIYGKIFRVGNGGFSLRSKKLIDLPNKLKLEWKPFHGFYNEDGFICAMYRHIYEEYGCKFAPIDVAKYFSHEADMPEIKNIKSFGFHGRSKLIEFLKNK